MSQNPWIGVDLDGTLAVYDGWKGPDHIGEPVPAMLERVKKWLTEGREVRIVTARVAASHLTNAQAVRDDRAYRLKQAFLIYAWCDKHLGTVLEVTAKKDFAMLELWDDRAVAVEANTGKQLSPSKLTTT